MLQTTTDKEGANDRKEHVSEKLIFICNKSAHGWYFNHIRFFVF